MDGFEKLVKEVLIKHKRQRFLPSTLRDRGVSTLKIYESLDSAVATKSDIERVERHFAELKYDILKWIIGLSFAQFSLLIGVLIKLSH